MLHIYLPKQTRLWVHSLIILNIILFSNIIQVFLSTRAKSTDYEIITMIHESKNISSSIYSKSLLNYKCDTFLVTHNKLIHILLKSYD